MLANHTGIATLFRRHVSQYDKPMKRQAFLEQYRKYPMFADGLAEFDEARAVVMECVQEYEDAEREDYLTRDVGNEAGAGAEQAGAAS
jgi:tubulin gamma